MDTTYLVKRVGKRRYTLPITPKNYQSAIDSVVRGGKTFHQNGRPHYGEVNGEGLEIFKDPITDDGMKKSAKGLLRVDIVNGEFAMKDQCSKEEEAGGELKIVFQDGKLLIDQSLSEIRARL